MPKRCPICNRSSDEIRFVGELCEKCAGDKLRERLPVQVEIERCRVCGKIRTKEGIREEDKDSLQSVMQQRFNRYKIRLISFGEGRALLDVVDHGWDQSFATEKDVQIKYNKITCESCYRRLGGYYEALLQLRGEQERMERFIERFKRYTEDRGEFIADLKEVEGGYDIYMSSKALAAAYLKEREIKAKTSYTLSGLDRSGKKVYKNTYAIRL